MEPSRESITPTSADLALQAQRRRAVLSSFFGGAVEYYDFFLYSLLAAVALGPLFFPGADPAVGLIASFATLAVGYVSRPLGALLMTVVGDKLGRKVTLLVTVTVMGCASVLVGLLPTYATIGVWAPILLVILRFVQGLSGGAEYGGGVLMAMEYAEKGKRGLASSASAAGIYSGILLANLALLLVTLLPRQEFLAWGWRLPFIVSAVLLGLTIWIRSRVQETPVFEEAKRANRLAKRPFVDLFRTQWRTLVAMTLVFFSVTSTAGLNLAFLPAYATSFKFTSTEALTLSLIGVSLGLVLMPTFGHLSDRVGRKRLTILGIVSIPFAVWGALALVSTGSFVAGVAGVVLTWTAHSFAYAPLGAWLAERFPTRFRYGGVSVAYQLAVIGSGFFPLIASSILARAGGPAHYGGIVIYMGGLSIIGLVVAFRIPETSQASFAEIDELGGPASASGAASSTRALSPKSPTS